MLEDFYGFTMQRDFGRRRHRQSGFQHTDRPRPSSPELSNKDHNAGRESLSHLNKSYFYFRATLGVKEVLQSSKFSTSIFLWFLVLHHSHSLKMCFLAIIFVFDLPLKLRVVHIGKNYKLSIFSKMAPTKLIKFCRFTVHSKPNNVTHSAFPEKIPETEKKN